MSIVKNDFVSTISVHDGYTLVNIEGMYEVKLPDDYDPSNDTGEYMSLLQRAYFKKVLINWFVKIEQSIAETMSEMSSIEMENRSLDEIDRANIEIELRNQLRQKDRQTKLMYIIERSLTKIDSNTYGYCQESGNEIGINRLKARPTTKYSIAVQNAKDRDELNVEDVAYNEEYEDSEDS